MPCTPITVRLAALTPNHLREVRLGITRSCSPDGAVSWSLDFCLLERRGRRSVTVADLHVAIGDELAPRAASLAETRSLAPAKLSLLENQIADLASSLPRPRQAADPELRDLLLRIL